MKKWNPQAKSRGNLRLETCDLRRSIFVRFFPEFPFVHHPGIPLEEYSVESLSLDLEINLENLSSAGLDLHRRIDESFLRGHQGRGHRSGAAGQGFVFDAALIRPAL